VQQDETTALLSQSFGTVAGDYDRLRPGPSAEALDWLLPPDATSALEVGAGTGVMTRLLAGRVPHVTAVEPDERMRDVLSGLASTAHHVDIVEGRAEALPGPDARFDVVVASSAWHWVDEARAVPEVVRVLRPVGRRRRARPRTAGRRRRPPAGAAPGRRDRSR
jgi:ubiquinone/menaquinone biosynthesis C-methylase UbiE